MTTQAFGSEITSEQAIVIAERFVADQGYTNAPSLSKDQIVHESMEWSDDADYIFSVRKGTLKSKAIGAFLQEGLWHVGFEYSNAPADTKAGRAVLMDKKGENIRVMHQELILEHLTDSRTKNK